MIRRPLDAQLLLVAAVCVAAAITYHRPMYDPVKMKDMDRKLNSNFMSFRAGCSCRFHGGYDIPLTGLGWRDTVYYAVTLAPFNSCTYRRWHGVGCGWIVCFKHRYADSTTSDTGSRYIHMDTIPDSLSFGDVVPYLYRICRADSFRQDTLHDLWRHLHFEMRLWDPIQGKLGNWFNPQHLGEELDCEDEDEPILYRLYMDYGNRGSAVVDTWDWEMNDMDFDTLHWPVSGYGTLYGEIKLPDETPHQVEDDAHIFIKRHGTSGTSQLYFTVRAKDRLNAGTGVPYVVALCVDTAITNVISSAGSKFPDIALADYWVQFDSIRRHGWGVDEYYWGSTVYDTTEPLKSGSEKYFRLYPYDTRRPSCVLTGADSLVTSEWDEGQHRIRVYAWDHQGT